MRILYKNNKLQIGYCSEIPSIFSCIIIIPLTAEKPVATIYYIFICPFSFSVISNELFPGFLCLTCAIFSLSKQQFSCKQQCGVTNAAHHVTQNIGWVYYFATKCTTVFYFVTLRATGDGVVITMHGSVLWNFVRNFQFVW